MSDFNEPGKEQLIGGRYRIESLLGHGGMSSVYKGFDPNLQRPVAIKLIHRHLSERPEWVNRFMQEASAIAKLRHPGIVQVYDFDKYGNTYYMVMEFVAGQTLDKKLEGLKNAKIPFPVHSALNIMSTLCDAVAYAHSQQIIHRDLKPSNVMMNLLDQPVLMDFGIAKMVGSEMVQTAVGTAMGTAAYMSPEQINGRGNIDHRADLYALGIILYELLSGVPPFTGNTPMTVMMKHLNEPVPDIRLLHRGLPDGVVAIIEKALQKDPNHRFQSAAEMAAALRSQLGSTGTYVFSPHKPANTVKQTAVSHSQPAVTPEKTAVAPNKPIGPRSQSAAPKRNLPLLPLAIGGGLLILALLGYFILPGLLQTPPPSTGMVNVPGGSYTLGNGSGGSQFSASQTIELDEFWIDRYEITNAQYATFAAETEAATPSQWASGTLPAGAENHPVQGTTWQMAADYCDWAGKRLPSEAEWEVAARGPQGWLYPWGDDEKLVALPNDGSYAVGTVPANRSSFGVYDMAGNVWEWVDEPYGPVGSGEQVLRGGAYDFQKNMVYRLSGNPDIRTMSATAGFRCAASEVEQVSEIGRLLLDDDFTAPDSGWPDMVEGNVLQGYHPPDFYHVQAGAPHQIAAAYFGGDFDNISLETAVFVDSTASDSGDFRYGLIFRRHEQQFYAFTISPRTARWFVLKGTADGLTTLLEGSTTDLHEVSNDKLRVDALGSSFTFSINDQVIAQLQDADYANGDIGFYVETFDETLAHIHYDAIQIAKLQSPEP